jgi:hypothetical protein
MAPLTPRVRLRPHSRRPQVTPSKGVTIITQFSNPNVETRNPKWFDRPFENLRVLSSVEGLTTLSHVEGQSLVF